MARSTATDRPKGLPRELTSFVGRRRELREAKQALASTALLTLTGPAGVGKTRLALRVAADLRRAFPHGVWMVELANLRDPALVAQAVAHAVGYRDVSARWLVSSLADFLATRRLLLILDNCEHLLDACAVLADALLRSCPDLKILATSREPLGIGGEATLQVQPLSLPAVGRAPPPEALLQSEAVRLFVERAKAASPTFDLTASNGQAVATLCQRLDGIPLAIELAAVRLRALTVGQILNQMGDRFRLLTTGSRAASPRQQTLRAAVEWSFGLLSEAERITWRRLSVFAGGFELETTEDVCSGDGLPRQAIPELVASLVEKSLVTRVEDNLGARYRMLETIRDFGRERLRESGEQPALQRRHRDWYMGLARQVNEHSLGPSQAEWWQRASVELPNLREALRFCLTTPGQVQAGLSIAADLRFYWAWAAGNAREGRRWLDELLQLDPAPTPQRGMALASSAFLAVLQMDVAAAAAERAEAARALATRLGDDLALCFVLVVMGLGALFARKLEEATTLLEDALRGWERLGDRRHLPMTLNTLGAVWSFRGDSARAIELFRASASISKQLGDRYFQASASQIEGMERWKLGELEAAAALITESIRLMHGLGDMYQVAMSVEALAWITMSGGEFARASRLMGGAQRLFEETGTLVYPPWDQYHDACTRQGRTRLGDAQFDRLFQSGRQASTETLMSLALQEQAEQVPQPRAERAGITALTRREQEIAGLVAQGLSNRDIASTLVISQRTAETHVEHILTKLGFTSRAQIAAWVAERQQPAVESLPNPAQR
jgi:predicted ATPase/DNA-binding CsgD family transcriptional regulator